MPAGRPTDYRPEYAKQAMKLAARALTDAEIAEIFGVNVATLWRWKQAHPEFCKALKKGKSEVDDRVEESLYKRAVGFTHDAVKVGFNKKGKPIYAPYLEYIPPDTTAGIFWLKCRRPDQWRDKPDGESLGNRLVLPVQVINAIKIALGFDPDAARPVIAAQSAPVQIEASVYLPE